LLLKWEKLKFYSSTHSCHGGWNWLAREARLRPFHEHHGRLPTLEICSVHASFHIQHHHHGTRSHKQSQMRSRIVPQSEAILLPPRLEMVLPPLRSLQHKKIKLHRHHDQFPLLRHWPLQNLQQFGFEITPPTNDAEIGGGDWGPGSIPHGESSKNKRVGNIFHFVIFWGLWRLWVVILGSRSISCDLSKHKILKKKKNLISLSKHRILKIKKF